MSDRFSIHSASRVTYPALAYEKMKDGILGKGYSLSLAFVGDAKSKDLNKQYRKKNKVANVLSFPLTKSSGEIFINPSFARKQAPKYGMKSPTFIAYLFIHALLHLKGMDHGDTMDEAEHKALKRFGLE